MNIIILGPPGSGKGTQARLLVDSLGLFYFESGKFLRELARKDLRIAEIINKGELIPEEEMTKYVTSYLEGKIPDTKNILFDGYPRFATQYRFLRRWLSSKDSKVDCVIMLKVSEKEIIRRLSARRRDKETGKIYNLITNSPPKSVPESRLIHRKDDKPEVIKERLREYNENTLPMISFIEKEGILMEVDGERSIKEIFSDIMARLGVKDVGKSN